MRRTAARAGAIRPHRVPRPVRHRWKRSGSRRRTAHRDRLGDLADLVPQPRTEPKVDGPATRCRSTTSVRPFIRSGSIIERTEEHQRAKDQGGLVRRRAFGRRRRLSGRRPVLRADGVDGEQSARAALPARADRSFRRLSVGDRPDARLAQRRGGDLPLRPAPIETDLKRWRPAGRAPRRGAAHAERLRQLCAGHASGQCKGPAAGRQGDAADTRETRKEMKSAYERSAAGPNRTQRGGRKRFRQDVAARRRDGRVGARHRVVAAGSRFFRCSCATGLLLAWPFISQENRRRSCRGRRKRDLTLATFNAIGVHSAGWTTAWAPSSDRSPICCLVCCRPTPNPG